jgi:hypothetical protein
VDARLIDAVQSFGTRGKIIHDEVEAGGIDGTPSVQAPPAKSSPAP